MHPQGGAELPAEHAPELPFSKKILLEKPYTFHASLHIELGRSVSHEKQTRLDGSSALIIHSTLLHLVPQPSNMVH